MKSLTKKLIHYLLHDPKALMEIYKHFPDQKKHVIRGRLNEGVNTHFKRIARGIYLAIDGEAQALILQGDAWKRIKDIEDNSIDAIITDIPYPYLNDDVACGTSRKKSKKLTYATRDVDEEMLRELYRVLKVGGHFFTFLPTDSQNTLRHNNAFLDRAMSCGFQFNKRFIWDKIWPGMGYNGRNRYEQIVFLSKETRRFPCALDIADVLSYRRLHYYHRVHESEKPVELIKDLIRFATKKKEIVLDPFGGSLSTAKAAVEIDRFCITFECDRKLLVQGICAGDR